MKSNRAAIAHRIVVTSAVAVALALIVGALQLSGCAAVRESSTHPLPGRIHDVRRNVPITKEALMRELASADFVLLGEVHDNPEHHRLQAEVLHALIARNRRPSLAMEQFDREYQSAIDAILAAPGASAEAIADAGGFNRKGWDWPRYAPLLSIAADARLPIVAINLSRNRTRDVARQGFASLGSGAVAQLALDRNWTAAQQAVQEREIDDGHCGQLPGSALPKMVDVQRARDATMADALVERGDSGVVVIAGNGHARTDVGIPVYLTARAPGKRVISVGMIEIDPDARDVGTYARAPATALPFDYAWFTTAAQRDDPCAGLVMPRR